MVRERWMVGIAYVDRPKSGSVPGCHVLVESFYRVCPRHLSVFLVHIVGARSRVVPNPYTEVLNLLRALLVDLEPIMLMSRSEF